MIHPLVVDEVVRLATAPPVPTATVMDIVQDAASAIIVLYGGASAAARFGMVPGRIVDWWHSNWMPHVREEERSRVIDSAVSSVPGLVVSVSGLTEQVAAIMTEMRPNHGTSLLDKVDRIETKVDAQGDRLDSFNLALASHLSSTSKHRGA